MNKFLLQTGYNNINKNVLYFGFVYSSCMISGLWSILASNCCSDADIKGECQNVSVIMYNLSATDGTG